MFIQVIEGRSSDSAGLRQAFERWGEQLQSGAEGWLGATAGVTDDGQFIAVVRFESEEAARRNSDRPEQGEWWRQTSQLFDGEATFRDSTDIDSWGAGGSDDAGFVQVIQGRAASREEVMREMEDGLEWLRENRPDVIGGAIAWFNGGEFVQTVYFTSEEDAREGERKMDDAGEGPSSVMQDVRFLDLREPWLSSP